MISLSWTDQSWLCHDEKLEDSEEKQMLPSLVSTPMMMRWWWWWWWHLSNSLFATSVERECRSFTCPCVSEKKWIHYSQGITLASSAKHYSLSPFRHTNAVLGHFFSTQFFSIFLRFVLSEPLLAENVLNTCKIPYTSTLWSHASNRSSCGLSSHKLICLLCSL